MLIAFACGVLMFTCVFWLTVALITGAAYRKIGRV
jgi:hypothetical protein